MHECKVPSGLPGSHRRLTGLQPCSSHHSRTSFVVAHHGNPPSHAPKDMAGRVALLPGATCLCSKAECVCVKVCVCVCVCLCLCAAVECAESAVAHACVVLSAVAHMPVWCCQCAGVRQVCFAPHACAVVACAHAFYRLRVCPLDCGGRHGTENFR